MNIVLGEENIKNMDERYLVLELDTFIFQGSDQPVTAYCLLEQLTLDEMFKIVEFKDLHTNLIANYRKQNWNFCEQAIEHLKGRWRGELDTFYDNLLERVETYKSTPPAANWDGTIDRSTSQPTAALS